tara:strand:+ start:170 stop:277 length:108 start_codon:yes stop_codon:yes gene_type:complete
MGKEELAAFWLFYIDSENKRLEALRLMFEKFINTD